MWIAVLIIALVLAVLWDHFFVPKLPEKPKLRPWFPSETDIKKRDDLGNQPSSHPCQAGESDAEQTQRVPLWLLPGIIYDEFTNYRGENGSSNYPPDWDARREKVKQRDGFHCQVRGCPNLEELDVHHIEMISEGGSHDLDNLTCLCIVHHWLLPHHKLVAERQPETKNTRRFTMRRAHWRFANGRWIKVRATFERYAKCTEASCETIKNAYHFRCPNCESEGIHFSVIDDDLVVGCLGCRSAWRMRCLLAEETGTLLASIFRQAEGRGGTFAFDLDLLPDREVEETVLCNECADFARIGILVPRNGRFGKFHGCTNYRTHQCRNSR
jgi:hypothetical protein